MGIVILNSIPLVGREIVKRTSLLLDTQPNYSLPHENPKVSAEANIILYLFLVRYIRLMGTEMRRNNIP